MPEEIKNPDSVPAAGLSVSVGSVLAALKRKPRHKYFSHVCLEADDGYFGPHDTIDAAIAECVASEYREPGAKVYVIQGYKMNRAEREEMGADYDWQCDSRQYLTFLPPNGAGEPHAAKTTDPKSQ